MHLKPQAVVVVGFALLWCTASRAQLPDQRDGFPDAGVAAADSSAASQPRPNRFSASLISAHPKLGKVFWISWGSLAALAIADNELTARCVQNHNCVELNPILGRRPTRPELYGLKATVLGIGFYLSRRSKLHGRSDWKIPPMVGIPVYGGAVVSDAIQISRIRPAP
jgi:hypothetical protein